MKRKLCLLGLFLGLLVAFGASTVMAENWPHWRGPNYDGISNETGIATSWGPEENIAWRLPLPGPAGASPIVWQDRLFVTSLDGEDLVLWCVSTGGKLLWQREVASGNRNARGDEGNHASPTPATDGERVVALMGGGQLACFDMDGNPLWEADLDERYGPINLQFGLASSPVLYEDRVYLQLIEGDMQTRDEEGHIVCLDAVDGSEIWNSPRPTGAHTENKHAYTSSLVYNFGGPRYLLTHGGDFTVAYSLDDGQELWRLGGLNPPGTYHPTLRFVASPGISPDLIVVPTAKNGPIVAVAPDGSGDITDTATVLWRRDQNTPDVPSPLIYGGLVYLCRENGNLLCLEANSGEEVYEERTVRDRHRASPLYADGKIYLTARNGTVTVIKAGREFEILATNEMGEDISASPAISDGTLYLRSFEALYAIRPSE